VNPQIKSRFEEAKTADFLALSRAASAERGNRRQNAAIQTPPSRRSSQLSLYPT
jgi:hypothetical protein